MSEPTVHHTVEVTGEGPVTLGIIEALRKHAPADARLSIREAQDAYGVTLTWSVPLEQRPVWQHPGHKPGCRCAAGVGSPRSAGQSPRDAGDAFRDNLTYLEQARQEAADTQRAEYVAHLEAEHEEISKGRPWTFNPGDVKAGLPKSWAQQVEMEDEIGAVEMERRRIQAERIQRATGADSVRIERSRDFNPSKPEQPKG